MEALQKLFLDYIAYAGQLREETASIKSVLGLREREIYDAGHKAFDKAVEDWAEAFCREPHGQEEVLQALERILFTAIGYEDKASFWYLCAVQRHAAKLIPLLDDSHRAELRTRFEEKYPAGRRLPIQRDIYQQLCKGAENKKKGFLKFW